MTTDHDFSTGQKTVKVPLMKQVAHFTYGQSSEAQVVELPYKGDDISMLVLLPKKRDGLPALESSLSAASLAELLKGSKMSEVSVTLPRFKIRSSLSLAENLEALGIKRAFVFKQADFSGIEAEKMLIITNVIHQAFVETDEMGTEAAAATAIAMAAGAAMKTEPPIEFKADHPFLYILREKKTGGILLMGRVSDPSA